MTKSKSIFPNPPALTLLETARRKRLTMRELEIMCHIATGKSSKEIANSLSISEKTVNNHRTSIKSKTGLRNGVEITLFILKAGK